MPYQDSELQRMIITSTGIDIGNHEENKRLSFTYVETLYSRKDVQREYQNLKDNGIIEEYGSSGCLRLTNKGLKTKYQMKS